MVNFENVQCLFSADIDETNGTHTIEVPAHELDTGPLRSGETYRVAVLPPVRTGSSSDANRTPTTQSRPEQADPPVEEGEVLDLEIEDLGEQGDGIARVGPGYVIIVNDAALGERVEAEITDVRENLAFADVLNYYDRS